jgi:signal transduction histidine kinase
VYKHLNDQPSLARTYGNMGRTALMQGKNGLALKFLDQALELAELHGLDRIRAAVLNTIGDVQQQMGHIDRALMYYEQSLELSRKLGIKRIITYSTRGMSEVYRLKGDLAKSNEYALATIALSREVGYRENVKNAAFILSENYSQTGFYDKALAYYKLGIAEKDSMFNAAKETEIENMRQNHELEKANREIQILQANNKLNEAETKRNRLQIYSMVVVLAFASLFGIVLYRNFMIQKKAKQELEAKKNQIEQKTLEVEQLNSRLEKKVAERTHELDLMINDLLKQNTDLEQFSYIISHNLRAPVARILGLTSIFDAANPDSADNPFILEMIQKSAGDLDTIIKDLTYLLAVRKSLNTAREWTNLQDVIQAELQHLSTEIKVSEAAIHTHFDPEPRIFAIKAYIHSILHNLISNAIKYRQERRPLRINISVRNTAEGVVLTIQDNGLGMSLSDPYKVFGLYQRMHTHVEGKGLGLYLVKTQVEAMNGSISVESKEGVGSTFTVSFPQPGIENEIHNGTLANSL